MRSRFDYVSVSVLVEGPKGKGTALIADGITLKTVSPR
jgi:hypothetical protein